MTSEKHIVSLTLEDIINLQQGKEITFLSTEYPIYVKYAGGSATLRLREYIDKAELVERIEHVACGGCRYHNAENDNTRMCSTCKVSLVHAAIAMGTPYNYLFEDMTPAENNTEN